MDTAYDKVTQCLSKVLINKHAIVVIKQNGTNRPDLREFGSRMLNGDAKLNDIAEIRAKGK
jgi:hypothetical protein